MQMAWRKFTLNNNKKKAIAYLHLKILENFIFSEFSCFRLRRIFFWLIMTFYRAGKIFSFLNKK